MKSFAVLSAVVGFFGLVAAQDQVDPNSVPMNQRLAWCVSQRTNCPQICGGQANPNTCDSNTLQWDCTCTNGNRPNISDYTQTMPFFVCETWKGQCVAAHPNDLEGQTACLAVTCGQRNATLAAVASTTSSAAASSTSAPSSTAASSGSAASDAASQTSAAAAATSSAAAAALAVAKNYGTGILGAGLLALFGCAL